MTTSSKDHAAAGQGVGVAGAALGDRGASDAEPTTGERGVSVASVATGGQGASVASATAGERGECVAEPAVTAVVLNWNGLSDTLACLASLSACSYPSLSVIVVDNGSRQSPAAEIAQRRPGVEVIENSNNMGYAAGNNVGIRRALAAGADFVWVLNNDTEVDPGALAALVREANVHEEAGAVGGKVLCSDDPGRIWVAWGRVTWRQSLIELVGAGCLDDGKFDDDREVEWLPGCSILFRAEALREAGLFDEDFFAYHEDVEWAARARVAGWTSRYTGASRIYHRGNAASGGSGHYGGFRKYLSARNSVLYARKHGKLRHKLFMAAAIVLTLPFQFLRRLATGEAGGVVMKVRGWRDALLRRPIPFTELGLR